MASFSVDMKGGLLKSSNRALLIVALYLILMGILFAALMLIPGVTLFTAWPIIFVVFGITLFLPAFIWPSSRSGLAALFVPGTMIVLLGLLFQYTTLTGDWAAWVYAWLLIPASFGLGLLLAGKSGGWSRSVGTFGLGIFTLFAVAYGLFAVLMGATFMKALGAGLVLLSGILIFAAAFRKPAQGSTETLPDDDSMPLVEAPEISGGEEA